MHGTWDTGKERGEVVWSRELVTKGTRKYNDKRIIKMGKIKMS